MNQTEQSTSSGSTRETGYLEVFQEVTRLISSVHDPQQVMDLVVRRLPQLLEVDAATIRLRDAGSDSFVLGAAWGVSQEYLSRSTIDSNEVLKSLLEGQPTAKTNLETACDHDGCSLISKEGIKSVMSLPILYKEQTIGLLRLLTKNTREFAESEISFAMSLAEQVGVAIANGRMFQEMDNQMKFFREHRDIASLVNSTLDLDQILTTIVEKLPITMGVKGCTIRLLHPATNRLDLAASSGLSEAYLKRGSIRKEDSIFRVLKGEPVVILDATSDPRVTFHQEIDEEGIKSILAVPIKNSTEIIGVLRLLTDHHYSFSDTEINFAVSVAEEGGNAIEKARTYRKITLLFNQIEEHERFLQTILDSLWLQLLVVDSNQRIILVNKNFLQTMNRTEEDTLGNLYRNVVPWRRDDLSQCTITAVLNEKRTITEIEHLSGDKKESSSWYERHLAPILDDEGRVEFVIEAIRDITSQKLLEEEQMARVKLEGVVEMAGTAAHELNSPLFAALGTAQLLRDDLESPEMIEEIDLIIRNLKKMGELTKQMTAVTGFEERDYVGETKIVKLTGQPFSYTEKKQ